MVNWLNLALLALTSGAVPAAAIIAQKHGPPVRVYVFTSQAGGAPSDEEQGRLDSVRDLTNALDGKRFTVVRSADDADMTVEVANREEREPAQGGFGGKSLTKLRDVILRIRVKAGEDQSELKAIQPSWGAAAKDLAKQLSGWATNHRLAEPDKARKRDRKASAQRDHALASSTWMS